MPLSAFLLLLLSTFPPLSTSERLQQPFVVPSSSSSAAASSFPASTIPAFPEQSDVASACPLHLPAELFPAVSRACSSPSPDAAFRLRCCPALAAWLFSAYAPAALSLRSSPADLPLLPDDSESCVESVEKSLAAHGATLPPLNDTCDVAYCFCGVRLRPLSCPRGLDVALDHGHWVARDANSRRLLRDCSHPGLPGCSRCLRTLHQIKKTAENASSSSKEGLRERDCELMGLTWLLAANRTRYLPAATKVLRVLMMTPEGKDPTSCVAQKGMPMAVDSADLDGDNAPSSSTRPGGRRRIAGMVLGVLLVVLVVV